MIESNLNSENRYELKHTNFKKVTLEFRLLTHKDEKDNKDIQSITKIKKGETVSQDVTTRLDI